MTNLSPAASAAGLLQHYAASSTLSTAHTGASASRRRAITCRAFMRAFMRRLQASVCQNGDVLAISTLEIECERVVNPKQLHGTGDGRDLGLRLTAFSWRPTV